MEYLRLADPTYEKAVGWIDMKGNFYPCSYTGHMDLMEELQDLGLDQDKTFRQIEEMWVKVTHDVCGKVLVLTYAPHLTPYQKVTIEKIILKHDMLDEGEWTLIADQEVRLEDGKVRFYRAA